MKRIMLVSLITILVSASISLIVPHVAAETAMPVRVWFSQYEAENEAMVTLAEAFESETGIPVEVVPRINIFNAADDLVNNAELDDRPDIVFMQAPDIGRLVSSGYLRPLTAFIDDDLKASYAEAAFSAFSYNGETYGVGYSIDSYGLVYNKSLIATENLPKTWDEFFTTAASLTTYDGDEVLIYGTLLNSRDMWFNYPLMRQYGGYYYGNYPNGDYNPYDVGLDHPGMIEYVAKMKELMESDLVLQSKIGSESDIVSRFANGKVAMIIYGLWYASTFQQRGIDYGIASLPDGRETSRALTTVQGFVINNRTEHASEAERFLRFILSDEAQQLLIEAGNGHAQKLGTRNPANRNVMASDYVQDDPVLASLSSLNDECEPFPNIPEGTIWYNYTTVVFQSIFFGDASGNPVDPQQKLTELADRIRADVALMNYTAERIEIPDWIWAVAATALIIFLALRIIQSQIRRRNRKGHENRLAFRETVIAWTLMLPLLGLLAVFYVYPILHNFYLSLTDYSGINLHEYGLIGFANYRSIITAGLQGLASMVVWTIIFAVSVVSCSFLLGTMLASVLNKVSNRMAKICRIIFILPWVIPTVITLLMWQGLLATDGGLVNHLLGIIGLSPIPWLSDPRVARLSSILVMTWFSFPYFMVVASGILKAIPRDYYEAARVDGAGSFFTFFYITLPLVFRALVPTLIMGFIMQFNQFGIYILTSGGPASDTIGAPGATDLLITYVFNTAFNTNRYAVAAAYSVIIFLFVGGFSAMAMRIGRRFSEV